MQQNSPDSLPGQFILQVREHQNHTKVMGGGGVMLTGLVGIFALQDWGSGTSGQCLSPERSCGSRTSQRHFSKNGVVELELREDVSLNRNCGSIPSEQNCGSRTSRDISPSVALRIRKFVKTLSSTA